jgi:hypothetical protein
MQKYMRSLYKVSGIYCPDLTKISCLSINVTSLSNFKFRENLFSGNCIIAGGHRETGIDKANRHIFANLIQVHYTMPYYTEHINICHRDLNLLDQKHWHFLYTCNYIVNNGISLNCYQERVNVVLAIVSTLLYLELLFKYFIYFNIVHVSLMC